MSDPLDLDATAAHRERLIEWARGELGMPWGSSVLATVADALGTTVIGLRAELMEQ